MTFHTKSRFAKLARLGGVVAAVMVGSFLVSRFLIIRQVARAASDIVPFTLEMKIHSQGQNAAEEVITRRIDARRSDGAKASIGAILGLAGTKAGVEARKVTLMDGSIVTLGDDIKAKTTWPKRATDQVNQVRQWLTHQPGNCIRQASDTLIGYDVVWGQRTAIVREKPIPTSEGQQVDTLWRAPGLACEILRYQVVVEKPDGSQELVTEGKAVSLKLGEPDSALFDTGENYTEAKPSELVRLEAQRWGLAWNLTEGDRAQDDFYLGLVAKRSRTLPKASSGR